MKKARAGSAASDKAPNSGQGKGQAPLEKVRSDLGGNTPRKATAGERPGTPAKAQLNKPFLSKSQDNLASQLRRKAVAAALSQKEAASNKENVSQKDKTASQTPRAKQNKGALMPIAKPASAAVAAAAAAGAGPGGDQGTPIKRAQSAQNIDKTSVAPTAGAKTSNSTVKRASSTQNISGGKSNTKVRSLQKYLFSIWKCCI